MLKAAIEYLDEVIVIQEIPLLIKKDTLIYDTKAFTTGKEYRLKNILDKLPGIEVADNGDITVNGKKVTKVLVEGAAFFGGSSKLAVENIPANAVDNVEVLDNYSEVAFLKGLADSDEMAMNITLKDEKKRFVFGDVANGLGEKGRYQSHSGIFYYSPITKMNFIGDLNDTGKKSFTINDYLNFEGGISKLTDKEGTSRANSIDNYFKIMNDRPSFDNKNKFAAINLTTDVNKNFSVSGYGIYSNVISRNKEETENKYFFENFSYDELITENQKANNALGIIKLSADYTSSFREKIFADLQVTSNHQKGLKQRLTEINGLLTDFNNTSRTKAIDLGQNFEWHKKLNSKHTSSLVINNSYSNTTPENFWNTNREIFGTLVPFIKEERIKIRQDINFSGHTLDIIAKHYWVLTGKSHVYTTLGNNFLNQDYSTEDFQLLSDSKINSFENAGFNNNLTFMLNDFYFGTHYKFKTGILTLKSGAYIHNYSWKLHKNNSNSRNKFIFLPNVSANLEIKPSEELTFTYRYLSNFTDAPDYADRFRILDYNKLMRGNTSLENELFQNGKIRYHKFAMYNGLILNGIINYRKKINYLRNQIQVVGVDQFLQPMLQENPEISLYGFFDLRKKIKKLDFKLNFRTQYSTFQKVINKIKNKDESFDTNIKMSVKSKFDKWPNIEVGYRTNFSSYRSSSARIDFQTNEPFGNIEYSFFKVFTFLFDYRLTEFNNKDTKTTTRFDLANISLRYNKKNSPLGFEISGSNLFDTKFKQHSIFSDFFISDRKDFRISRILMVTLHYKL